MGDDAQQRTIQLNGLTAILASLVQHQKDSGVEVVGAVTTPWQGRPDDPGRYIRVTLAVYDDGMGRYLLAYDVSLDPEADALRVVRPRNSKRNVLSFPGGYGGNLDW